MTTKGPISQFMNHHYRHFNAAAMMHTSPPAEK
jgi:hypothetical protein